MVSTAAEPVLPMRRSLLCPEVCELLYIRDVHGSADSLRPHRQWLTRIGVGH